MTVTHSPNQPTNVRRKRTLRRKILIACAGLLTLVIVVAGVLWILKPWVPDMVLVEPGPTGQRVNERGVYANYFPAKGTSRGPAVLVLGGSDGGIQTPIKRSALDLQAAGFHVLTPSYFGAPGQPKQLELIPLETFDRALVWLRSRPEVDPNRIGVAGQSKGSEAALLIGVRHPELKAVIASAPTSAVWPGVAWDSFDAESSWTSSGRPLPVVPYGGVPLFGDIGRVYREGIKNLGDHPDAAIAVERIRAPVLLVCGEEDDLWPACPMARQLNERSEEKGGPSVQVLGYRGAGHSVFGPAVPRTHELYQRLARWGGTPEGTNRARADAWPKVIEFLKSQLIV
jgi:uncharacterized protein